MKKLWGLLVFFSFFPYFKLIPTVDTQPISLIISVIIFFLSLLKDKKIKKIYTIFILTPLISILFIDPFNVFQSIRSYFGYLSILVITYSIHRYYDNIRFSKILKISINLWFIVGFIQTFISRRFMESFISDMRTTANRGVTGLAPEPTFYGIICIYFIILILEVLKKKEQKKWILNVIIQIMVFNKSSMTILFLVIFMSIIMIRFINIKIITFGAISFIGGDRLIRIFLKDTRVYHLYTGFLNSPLKIFYTDYSMNQRLSHIYYSIKGMFNNYLMPNGFSYWTKYSIIQSSKTEFFYSFNPSGKIMSGYGGILFETGILGVLLITIIFYIQYNGLKNKYIACFLLIINFSAIQLSFPMNYLILGIGVKGYLKKRRLKNE